MAIRVLLISGSTRAASTNTAALRAMHEHAHDNIETIWYDGLSALPAFNPDDTDRPPPPVAALRAAIDAADAVLLCTPEYAGSLPGSVKNLLDWTVRGGGLYEKPVAYVSVAAEGRGAGAEATLRTVLGYVGAAILEDACVRVYVAHDAVASDGRIADESTVARLAGTLRHVAELAASAHGRPARDLPAHNAPAHDLPAHDVRAHDVRAHDVRAHDVRARGLDVTGAG